MERGGKKHYRVKKSVYPLNLGDWIPQKDVRKIIWNKLNRLDKLMVWSAHGVHTYMKRDLNPYVRECVQHGYLDLTLFFLTEKKHAVKHFILDGAYYGHLHMIEWILVNFPEEFHSHSIDISRNAASGGHVKILEFVEKQGKPLCKYLCSIAARSNHTNVIKWGIERGYDFYPILIITHTSLNGNIWKHTNKKSFMF